MDKTRKSILFGGYYLKLNKTFSFFFAKNKYDLIKREKLFHNSHFDNFDHKHNIIVYYLKSHKLGGGQKAFE